MSDRYKCYSHVEPNYTDHTDISELVLTLYEIYFRSNHSFFMLLSSLLLDVSGRDAAALPITTDFWPPAMSSAVPRIVGLLDNSSVTSSQVAGELNTLIIEPFHFRTTQDVYTVNSFDHSWSNQLIRILNYFPFFCFFNFLMVCRSFFTVSEVAKTTLWECLVDDPMLFFRTFFEDITKPNKQVRKAEHFIFFYNTIFHTFLIVTCCHG